jgi:hypothetical protein
MSCTHKNWMKVDPDLRSHPAFAHLSSLLNEDAFATHAILIGLWSMAFRQADDGDLTRFKPGAIAAAIGYKGDPDNMVDALIEAGFLDRANGDLTIHDWYSWGGALYKERERKRTDKQRERTSKDSACRGDVATTSPHVAPHIDIEEEVEVEVALLPKEEEKNSPAADSLLSTPSTRSVDKRQEGSGGPFDRVWTLWPKKEREDYARQQYDRLSDGERGLVLVVAEELARRVPEWTENAKKVTNLATWLRERRWTEWAHGVPTTWQNPTYPGPVFKGYENKAPEEPKQVRAEPKEPVRVDLTSDELDALLGSPAHSARPTATLDRRQRLRTTTSP